MQNNLKIISACYANKFFFSGNICAQLKNFVTYQSETMELLKFAEKMEFPHTSGLLQRWSCIRLLVYLMAIIDSVASGPLICAKMFIPPP